jgi:hypothetical protein
MKSKKGFQFFPFSEKIMGTSIFSTKKSFEESIFSGNGKNHAGASNFSLARLM